MGIPGHLNAIALATLLLGFGEGRIVFAETASRGVPTFDVSRTCTAEAADAPSTRDGCISDEQAARDQLTREWQEFSVADRTNCAQPASSSGGIQSYVELLTCLQTARDARKLPKE